MTESEMADAVIWGVIGWLCLVVFCVAVIFVLCRKDPKTPPPDPAFREDRDVAALESIPLPDPWSDEAREGLRQMAPRRAA